MSELSNDETRGTGGEDGAVTHVVAADFGPVYKGLPLDWNQQAAHGRRAGWKYFAEYQFRILRVYLISVLFYDIGALLLYLLTMGVVLGTLVDAGSQTVDGVSYLTFVAPAIVVSSAVTTAVGELSFPVMEGFKWQRTYLAAASTPVSAAQIAMGHHLTVVLRNFIQAALGLSFLWMFGALQTAWAWLLVPVAVLAGSAFGAALQAYSATLENEGFQFAAIQRFVVMPMFLFAGTFFPLTNMPPYLQWVGWLSPIWHGSELGRAATYGHELSPLMTATHLAFLAVLTIGGLLAAVRVYRRRLSK